MRVLGIVAAVMLAGCGAEMGETPAPGETGTPVNEAGAGARAESALAESDAIGEEVADDDAIDLCSLSAQRRWDYAEGQSVIIDAAVSCEDGQRIARRDILDADGGRLYEFSAPAEHIAVLAWAESDEGFLAAFAEWADRDPWRTRTSELPNFDARAEFPFYPSTTDPALFAAWRAGNHPMECFVQGMESLMCVAMIDGEAVEMGVQSFPG